jgi:DNA-binding GntR family transcriptional regulator
VDRAAGTRPGAIAPRLIVDDVYVQIMALIIDGHVLPGDALSIDALAREFTVSSTPVREALARLESTGLVRRMALRGYRVAPLMSPEELDEIIDARLVLEPVAARRAAALQEPALLPQLRASVDSLAKAPRGEEFQSFREYVEADQIFHHLIFAHAGNRFLDQAYQALGGQVQRFRLFAGAGVTDAEATIAEHGAVLRAIEAGDPEGAAASMTAHLAGVRSRVLDEIAQRGHAEGV